VNTLSAPVVKSHRYLREALQHADVRRLLASATRHETQHAGGRVTWHEWGKGPSVVLLHGGFGSWLHWVRNIDRLSAHFRVLAADLPGLGESDPVTQAHPSAAAVAAPLVDGLGQLLRHGERLRLACFSLGAVIGGQVAAAMRPRLARLVLLGPSGLGDLWRNVTTDLARRHPDMSREVLRATIRQNLQQSMIAQTAAIDDMAIDIQTDLVRQKRRLIGMPLSLSNALVSVLPDLAPRLTVIWGELDRYPTPDVPGVAAILRRRLPQIDVRIVPRAGHWVSYEAAAEIDPQLVELFSQTEIVE
jgi:pimeloyl-ACP methyl ester carboxylesterase